MRDLLGKITEIIDKNGSVMVSYTYNAWGNWINKDTASLGDTLVIVNPFIYKGYYYDRETDWYYLKSRYYCSMLSRFINMDNTNYLELGSVTGGNLFAYCNNDPVRGFDSNGNFSFKKLWKITKNVVKKMGQWVTNNIESSINTVQEISREISYNFLYTIESGTEFTNTTSKGKLINFKVSGPSEFWKIWEYSIGLDITYKGKGLGINIGSESSLNLYFGDSSFSVFANSLGRFGFSVGQDLKNGFASYTKFSLNAPEIIITAVVIYFAWPYLLAASGAWASMGAPLPQ